MSLLLPSTYILSFTELNVIASGLVSCDATLKLTLLYEAEDTLQAVVKSYSKTLSVADPATYIFLPVEENVKPLGVVS